MKLSVSRQVYVRRHVPPLFVDTCSFSPTMALPTAQIRPYATEDRKLTLFMISKSNFQGLAIANNKSMSFFFVVAVIDTNEVFQAYTHPVTIAIWLALSSVFIQYMSWWPSNDLGWLSYLKPFPAFASLAVPIMFAVDWYVMPNI
jgi:hypothetical protein